MTTIDYTGRDYDAILAHLLTYASELLPEWTSRDDNDVGMVLTKMFAYLGDVTNLYIDFAVNEMNPETIQVESNMYAACRFNGYRPKLKQNASVKLQIVSNAGFTLAKGTVFIDSIYGYKFFTIEDVIFAGAETKDVSVVQGEIKSLVLGTASVQPYQKFELTEENISEFGLSVFSFNGVVYELYPVMDTLLFAGVGEKACQVSVQNKTAWLIEFGDGINGKQPYAANPVMAEYTTSEGSLGNTVDVNTITNQEVPHPAIVSVTNADRPTGGAEPEGIESIRLGLKTAKRNVYRAVGESDYEELSVQHGGIAKAKAASDEWDEVFVYIVPTGGGEASPALLAGLQDYLQRRAMAKVTVSTIQAEYVEFDVEVKVYLERDAVRSEFQNKLLELLTDYFSLDNIRFGRSIYVQDVYDATYGGLTTEEREKVDRVTITKLALTGQSGVGDIPVGPLTIGKAISLVVVLEGGIFA